jgi:hypothetical protein
LQEIPIAPQYVLMDSLFDDAWSDTLGWVETILSNILVLLLKGPVDSTWIFFFYNATISPIL